MIIQHPDGGNGRSAATRFGLIALAICGVMLLIAGPASAAKSIALGPGAPYVDYVEGHFAYSRGNPPDPSKFTLTEVQRTDLLSGLTTAVYDVPAGDSFYGFAVSSYGVLLAITHHPLAPYPSVDQLIRISVSGRRSVFELPAVEIAPGRPNSCETPFFLSIGTDGMATMGECRWTGNPVASAKFVATRITPAGGRTRMWLPHFALRRGHYVGPTARLKGDLLLLAKPESSVWELYDVRTHRRLHRFPALPYEPAAELQFGSGRSVLAVDQRFSKEPLMSGPVTRMTYFRNASGRGVRLRRLPNLRSVTLCGSTLVYAQNKQSSRTWKAGKITVRNLRTGKTIAKVPYASRSVNLVNCGARFAYVKQLRYQELRSTEDPVVTARFIDLRSGEAIAVRR